MSRSIATPIAQFAGAAVAAAMAALALRYAIAWPEEDALREFLVVTGIIVVSAAVVFGVVIPRALAAGGSARVALTLSVLGLLLAVVYWAGLPPVLAVGGIVLGRRSEGTASSAMTRAAVVVGVLALVADVAILVAGSL
jgi:hypothetical protein